MMRKRRKWTPIRRTWSIRVGLGLQVGRLSSEIPVEILPILQRKLK